MNKSKINDLDVIYERITPIIVTIAVCQGKETYFIFRKDNTEVKITMLGGKIYHENPKLKEHERYYFTNGYYKEIKNKY